MPESDNQPFYADHIHSWLQLVYRIKGELFVKPDVSILESPCPSLRRRRNVL